MIRPFVGKPAILDSNILLLQWCFHFDRTLVQTFKRLNSFEAGDITLLDETLRCFPILKTTPHVLTEVSNLANSLPDWRKDDWASYFSRQIEIISEESIPAKAVAKSPLLRLGLTDAALAELAGTHVILTVDWPLTNHLETLHLSVINFTRLRELRLQ